MTPADYARDAEREARAFFRPRTCYGIVAALFPPECCRECGMPHHNAERPPGRLCHECAAGREP